MMLTEFLLARIAEDEECATAATGAAAFQRQTGSWKYERVRHAAGESDVVFALADKGGKTQVADLTAAWDRDARAEHIVRHDPARVLAECEAKRLIVEQAEQATGDRALVVGEFSGSAAESDAAWAADPGTLILKALASVYADHPDYREEWRP